MTASKTKKTGILNRLEGDKVVWIIVLMLILLSIVCIFSSTSRLLGPGETRLDMVLDQLKTVGMGLVVIFLCYICRSTEVYRFIARWSFLLTLVLLLFLHFGPTTGPIRSISLNASRRAISVFGLQFFVFEAVKVLMILYLSWATDMLKRNEQTVFERFVRKHNYKLLMSETARKMYYLFIPFLITCVLILPGSNTAAVFIGFIMILTILLGGGGVKDVTLLFLLGVVLLAGCFSIYSLSDGKVFQRLGTAISGSRTTGLDEMEKTFQMAKTAKEKQKALDKLRQPYSARIAIKEGGVLGKGPGQSTQRYMVPDVSEDYIFSFIIEEYGLWGAFIVIFLYVSLLARGSIIARNCGKDEFAKTTVAGMVLLISMQAFLHMFVNVGIGPTTGQTLPLISHGNSAFLCFCMAFGIILSMSRIAQHRIEKEEQEASSLVHNAEETEN
ncbi:MAG: FtsW/RodA/SpoVE family cell cycle protein [Bacteroidales bacterium]|nr:FtsW/RodA/SpoVE family cell cycle protein [Bacteroidales bacterium]